MTEKKPNATLDVEREALLLELERASSFGSVLQETLGETAFSQIDMSEYSVEELSQVAREIAELDADWGEEVDLSEDGLDVLLGTARLLRHHVEAPELSTFSMARIERELFEAYVEESPARRRFSLGWLASWSWQKPAMLVAGVACVCLLTIASLRWSSEPRFYGPQALEIANSYTSPWYPGVDPVEQTKNPTERLDKVMDTMLRDRQERWLSRLQSQRVLGQRF